MTPEALAAIRNGVKDSDVDLIVKRCMVERTRYIAVRNKFHRTICAVCSHQEIDEINRLILIQVPCEKIGETYGFTEKNVVLHWRYHVRAQVHSFLPPTDGPKLKQYLAQMIRKRAVKKFPLHDLRKQLEYVLMDLMLVRRVMHGDIAEDGLIVDPPSMSGIVAVDKVIVQLAIKLDEVKSERKDKKPERSERDINPDLVPVEQQKVIDDAARMTKEAIDVATREQGDVQPGRAHTVNGARAKSFDDIESLN